MDLDLINDEIAETALYNAPLAELEPGDGPGSSHLEVANQWVKVDAAVRAAEGVIAKKFAQLADDTRYSAEGRREKLAREAEKQLGVVTEFANKIEPPPARADIVGRAIDHARFADLETHTSEARTLERVMREQEIRADLRVFGDDSIAIGDAVRAIAKGGDALAAAAVLGGPPTNATRRAMTPEQSTELEDLLITHLGGDDLLGRMRTFDRYNRQAEGNLRAFGDRVRALGRDETVLHAVRAE